VSKKYVLLIVLVVLVTVQVYSFSEGELLGTWEVSSRFSGMVLTVYSFEENGVGVIEIVLNAAAETEERTIHHFIYEIQEDILFITLVDETTRQPLTDKQSGKTQIDKYRIIFIEEREALLQTADRDVVLIRQ
jgi:hypothetical protein